MPYDRITNKWTPDPEDLVYTDPDGEKYLTERGDDLRFGVDFFDEFVPDPPEIVEMKKSGEWAKRPPFHRRLIIDSLMTPRVSPAGHALLREVKEFADKARANRLKNRAKNQTPNS
jgi:hypothetical protein